MTDLDKLAEMVAPTIENLSRRYSEDCWPYTLIECVPALIAVARDARDHLSPDCGCPRCERIIALDAQLAEALAR